MSSDITRGGTLGRSPSNGMVSRQFGREADLLAARTQLTYLTNAAHAFITAAAVQDTRGVLREIRDAIEEDPLGTELYADIARAYGSGVAGRIRTFGS